MPPPRYARPRLITPDDKRYRAYVQQFVIQRANTKAMRPPRQRDLFGGQAEHALRDWLATSYTLSDRRILEYEERRGRSATTKYREIDALAIDGPAVALFEIKASRTASALYRAMRQLRETREILRLLYRSVTATILLVDTGIPTADDVAALMSSVDPPPRQPPTLDEVIAALPDLHLARSLDSRSGDPQGVDLLCFGVEDIIALVGADRLSLDWAADDEEPEEEAEPRPTSSLFSSSDAESTDDDSENPFAAALRKAGLS